MMRAAPIAIVLSIAAGTAWAQPADEAAKSLEACAELARNNDEVCTNPANSAAERLDCFRKARTARLQCPEHAQSEPAPGSAPPDTPSGSLESCVELARSNDEVCTNPANSATERLDCFRKARTARLQCPEHAQSEPAPGGSAPPDTPSAGGAQDMAGGKSARDTPATEASPEMPVGSASPTASTKTADIPSKPANPDWIVSETTSPLDYSPLITAEMRIQSTAKNAPAILAVRCRGLRTELVVRTDGTWRAPRAHEVQVDYQVNDQPVVRQKWALSVDGKTASYRDDAVGLLRSLPDGGRLKINVPDQQGPGENATFRLAGFDVIRKKIAAACAWAPTTDKVSARKH
jgi:hypothetical protein